MEKVLEVREEIDNQFHNSSALESYFSKPENAEKFAAYYTSMYLIQDSGEAVFSHNVRGFSSDSMQAYIELWGVMQAVIVQQDAIRELYRSITGETLNTSSLKAWNGLRVMRNLCAGHPSRRSSGGPLHQRTFLGRGFGGYGLISCEIWDANTRERSHLTFPLRKMIRDYDVQVAPILQYLLYNMRTKWP